jgi:hypothetical protein
VELIKVVGLEVVEGLEARRLATLDQVPLVRLVQPEAEEMALLVDWEDLLVLVMRELVE